MISNKIKKKRLKSNQKAEILMRKLRIRNNLKRLEEKQKNKRSSFKSKTEQEKKQIIKEKADPKTKIERKKQDEFYQNYP